MELPHEAVWTEFVVGLLQVELNDGAEFANFAERLREACHVPPPTGVVLDEAKLHSIRERVRALLAQWQHTRVGETLELAFRVPARSAAV